MFVWNYAYVETARISSGRVRAGTTDNGLFNPGIAVVRGGHRPLCHSCTQSSQRVRGQDSWRKDAGYWSQVRIMTIILKTMSSCMTKSLWVSLSDEQRQAASDLQTKPTDLACYRPHSPVTIEFLLISCQFLSTLIYQSWMIYFTI